MRLDVQVRGNQVRLAGRIDDTAAFADIPARLPAGEVVIDTEGVTFVNSIGMREWIRLVRALRESGHTVRLERVADVLMTQMNLIAELRGAVTISSFHAQYACAACGAEAAPVVDVALAPVACPECGAAMELADFPERYVTIFKG
jgi:anti-anti-sigma regulatory factor/DNA-directed RNA polymerase subunit RPC12/RpoP